MLQNGENGIRTLLFLTSFVGGDFSVRLTEIQLISGGALML